MFEYGSGGAVISTHLFSHARGTNSVLLKLHENHFVIISAKGCVSSQITAFLTGHFVARYVRSLAPLTPLIRSAALHFAMLALLIRSVHGLAHSLRSLPPWDS